MAIVKETRNSLRWFLIIVGGYGAFQIINIVPAFKTNIILGLIFLISVVFGFITLYFGIKFFSIIQANPKLIDLFNNNFSGYSTPVDFGPLTSYRDGSSRVRWR